jgi:hypothetical protein
MQAGISPLSATEQIRSPADARRLVNGSRKLISWRQGGFLFSFQMPSTAALMRG